MKKLFLVLAVILLLISGCANKEPKSPYNAEITETKAPKYFISQAAMPDGSLFGLAGTTMTIWNPKDDETKTIGDAWSAVLSPDAAKVAFINDQGLQIMDLASGSVTPVDQNPAAGDASLESGLWSPDADQFIYMFVKEWSSDYFIYNTQTGEKKEYAFGNVPNFLSTPVDWNENGLLFTMYANKSKAEEQEYRENGYRSNLMLADDNGQCTPLTDTDDGYYVIYCDTTSDNRTSLVVIYDENIITSTGLLNLEDKKISILPVGENTVEGSISPDGKFAVLVKTPQNGHFSAQIYDLENNVGITEKELIGYEPPRHFIWSDDGRTVSFGLKGEDGDGVLYTVDIK